MNIIRLIIAAILVTSLLSAPAMADSGYDTGEKSHTGKMMQNPCAMEHGKMKHQMMGKKMGEYHRMMTELMEMMRETMTTLKNLDHRPTPAEKKRLGEMADRLDGMINKHEKMREHHKKMREKQGKM
ncbi:MAG: hypothetical protein ACE5GF_00780 [Thermodesulfobacteriota bacterium]